MTLASASPSVWSVHAGHLVLLAGWALCVAGSLLWTKIRARPAAARPPLVRSIWIPVACAASAVSGGVHVAVIREHFAESLLYGSFFLVLALAQFAWTVAVLLRPLRSVLFAGAVASIFVVLLWLATRTIGIPFGPAAGETEPFGGLDVIASAAEALVAAAALTALVRAVSVSTDLQPA